MFFLPAAISLSLLLPLAVMATLPSCQASVIEALASAEWDAEQAAKPAVDESKEMEVIMGGDWKVLETA